MEHERRDSEVIVLRDYAATLRARWIVVLAAMLAGGVVAGALAATQPKSYAAAVLLLVQAEPGAIGSVAEMREVLATPSIHARIREQVETGPDTPFELAVEEVPGTRLRRVHGVAGNADTAARVANIAAAELQAIDSAEADAVRQRIDEQLKAAEESMRTVGSQLEAVPQADLLQQTSDRDKDRVGLGDLIVDLEGEKARLAAARTQLSRTPQFLKGGSEVPSTLVGHLARPSASGADGAVTADGPVLFRDDINPVYAVLQYQVTVSLNRVAELERERRALQGLLQVSGSDLAQLRQIHGKRIALRRLQSEYELTERIYMDLRTRFEQQRVEHSSRESRLQMVEKAHAPSAPVSRHIGLAVLLGLLVSGVLASALVLAMGHRPARG